jgi:hypothetical protein
MQHMYCPASLSLLTPFNMATVIPLKPNPVKYRVAQKKYTLLLFILHVKVCIYFLGQSVLGAFEQVAESA